MVALVPIAVVTSDHQTDARRLIGQGIWLAQVTEHARDVNHPAAGHSASADVALNGPPELPPPSSLTSGPRRSMSLASKKLRFSEVKPQVARPLGR